MHFLALDVNKIGGLGQGLLSGLQAYSPELRCHRGVVAALLERSGGTLSLLFKILEYRNYEVLSKKGSALNKDTETLKDIAYHTKKDNEAMKKLAEQNKRDTRSIKALSILGTMYLPATFIATMFSSSLIQLESYGESKAETHFVPATQFWWFIILTIPLMVLTLGYMLWVGRG